MIAIKKSNNKNYDYLDFTPLKNLIGDTVNQLNILYLKHDAYKVSLINSDGRKHSIKIGGEIFKLNINKILSILIKVYQSSSLDKMEFTDENTDVYDFVEKSLLVGNIGCKDWTILFHENTIDILKKLYPDTYKTLINDHINRIMKVIYNKNSVVEELKASVHWNLYRVLNIRDDLGTQFVLNSKEFQPIGKLLIMDYLYEAIFNEDSMLDSAILHTSHDMDERLEQILRILNTIGQFTVDFNSFGKVQGSLENGLIRFGLPTYLVYNIMEEKYLRNNVANNVGFNYIDIVWEKRIKVIEKIREFVAYRKSAGYYPFGENMVMGQGVANVITARVPGAPEPAITANNPMDIKIIKNTDNNTVELTGLKIDRDNLQVIQFRDLMLGLEGLRDRWETIKAMPSDEDNRSEHLETLKYDLKGFYNKVQDARYRLRLGSNDNSDMDGIESAVFNLMDAVENDHLNRAEGLGEAFGYGEGVKVPKFIAKLTDDIKFSLHNKKDKSQDWKKFKYGLMGLLKALLPFGVGVMVSDAKVFGDQKKILKEHRRKKWEEGEKTKAALKADDDHKINYKGESFSYNKIGLTTDELFEYGVYKPSIEMNRAELGYGEANPLQYAKNGMAYIHLSFVKNMIKSTIKKGKFDINKVSAKEKKEMADTIEKYRAVTDPKKFPKLYEVLQELEDIWIDNSSKEEPVAKEVTKGNGEALWRYYDASKEFAMDNISWKPVGESVDNFIAKKNLALDLLQNAESNSQKYAKRFWKEDLVTGVVAYYEGLLNVFEPTKEEPQEVFSDLQKSIIKERISKLKK